MKFVFRCLGLLCLVAVLGAFLPSPSQADVPAAVPFSQSAYDAAIADGKPMLVEITAPWCPTCAAQKKVMATLLTEPRFADLTILEIDFDSQKDLVRAFGARMQSTLIVYSDGKEVARGVGTTKPAKIEALLDSAY